MRLLRATSASLLILALTACQSEPDAPPTPTQPVEETPIQVIAEPSVEMMEEESAPPTDIPEVTQPAANPLVDSMQVRVDGDALASGEGGESGLSKNLAGNNQPLQIANLGSGKVAGGLGLRGIGQGGGGISGLGQVDTGGGKGTGAKIGKRRTRSGSARSGKMGGSYGSVGYGRGAGSLGERPNMIGSKSSYGRGVRRTRVTVVEPSSREGFRDHGTNAFVDPAKDRLSTFAADVDTGSYTVARRRLEGGSLPPAAAVRVEEFVNYFSYNYAKPKNGAFAVDLEAAPSPFSAEPNTYVMRVGVQGKSVDAKSRKAVHLTFLVDVSGSMSSQDKMGLVKKSLKLLTNNLQQGDTVAIATYAGRVAEILKPTGMQDRQQILNAINSLGAGGSTAMNDGLKLAYTLALQDFKKGDVNRVIVLSDGDANVGPSSHEEILKQIKSYVDEGVTLSTIGFGMGNYQDTLMEQLANKGNGNYYYLDSFKEARKVFGDQLDGTLQVIAKDVKLQVEFDPDAVKAYRLIGYENRDVADKDFRNDKVDAGEIGAGHRVTALYEVKLRSKPAGRIATVRVRHKKADGHKASEAEFYFTGNEIRTSVGKASKDFQFATAVAGFAEILRKSPHAKKLSYELILEVAQASTKGRSDRKAFIKLVKTAKRLHKST